MTLLLLHAFPLDGRMWAPQVAALSADLDVLAPDLRGFGANAPSASGLDEIPIDLVADDMAALLAARGSGKAAVAGISRGTYVAMAMARRHPASVEKLILMDSRATPADEAEKQNWAVMAARLTNDGIGFLPELMRARLLGPNAAPGLADRAAEIILSQNPVAVAAAARGMATRPDARPGLASITVPTLAIAGTDDAAFESTKAIAQAIRGAAFLAVEGAGHLSNWERPDFVTDAIRTFLTV